MLKSEEQSFKEELRHKLSSAIIHYNRFKSYTEKEKEKNMPDPERIKWELMQEKGIKYYHFSDQYSESLNAVIEELMQEIK